MSASTPIAVDVASVVDRVPEWRGRAVVVAPLPGGMTNQSYVVTVDGRRHVVRIPGDRTDLLGVDRANERHNTEVAARTGVGPRVTATLPDLPAMVVEFVEGRTLAASDLRVPGMPARLARTLRLLHDGPRFLHDFDMFRLIDTYVAVAATRDILLPPRYPERLPLIRRLGAALALRRPPAVPCHNDLLAENVIDDGRRLVLVDWEYSGNGDPTFELGNACRELDYGDEHVAELALAYFGDASPARLARIRLQMIASDAGWTLWAAIQATISRIELDFHAYGAARWVRAEADLDSPALGPWLDLVQHST